MTLLCYSSSGVATNDLPRVKNYDGAGSPGTLVAASGLITSDPLYTKTNAFHFGGNRHHYGNSLETTNQVSGSEIAADFAADRLPIMSAQADNTWAALGAALPGSAIYTNLQNRGIEIKNWQDSHRGQGKWGATFTWALAHECNASARVSANGGTIPAAGANWLAAMHNIIEIWKSVGVILWDGENDFTTYTEGLMPGICLLGGRFADPNDIELFWPSSNTWANQNLVFYAPDVYNGSANLRYWPPQTIFDPIRGRCQTKAASQAALGRPFLQFLYEHACAEIEHFTSGAGGNVAEGPGWNTKYPGVPYTKAFWQSEAAAYLGTQWPDLAALVYWDSNAGSGPGSVGASNFLDSSQEAWDTFVSEWANSPNFTSVTDPLPSGTPPAPTVDSPTVLQSSAIINSGVGGTVFNSSLFNIGPDELVLIWTEAERADGVQPGIPTMSFPASPTAGTNPALTRISGADHQWITGGYFAQQGLWVASTKTSGPASGVGLRVTWPGAVGGCTVVMERIVGANLSGAVTAAVVGTPTKVAVASATGISASLPAPANTRNRSFALTSHRMNEPTNPGGGPKSAILLGNYGQSIAPVAGREHLAVFYLADGGGIAPLVNSVTGAGLTWVKRSEQSDTANQGTVSVWEGTGTPTAGIVTATFNIGNISLVRAEYIDIVGGSGIGNIRTDFVVAGQPSLGQSIPLTYQQTTSGMFTAAMLGQNAAAVLNPFNTTLIPGSGGAQGVTDEIARFQVWKATFDDSRPTFAGYTWTEPHYFYAAVFLEILAPGSVMAEGADVSRTSPGPVGIETSHSVSSFQQNIVESWATPVAAGITGIEIAAGPPAAGVRLGSTSPYITTFETMLGRSVDSQRVSVADSAAIVNWGSGGWATAAAANAAGRAVFVSCFLGTNTWAQIAAGNANAFLDTIGANLATFSQPGVFAYFPEPEDDTATRGTSAQFRAAATFVINRLRPLMPGWRFANVLQDATWFGTSAFNGTPYFVANGRVADDWIVPEADILAVNAYNYKGAIYPTHPYADFTKATYTDMPVSLFANSFLATAAARAKYAMLSEFGCAVDDPAVNSNGHAARAAWIGSAMAYMKGKVELVHYSDLDSVDGRINLRITGGIKAAEQDSVDAFLTGASVSSITKTHTTNAIIRKIFTKTHTATAIVRKVLTCTQSADAQINAATRKTQAADAIISKAGIAKTHQSDCYISPYVLVTHVTSASGSSTSLVTVS